jgi:flagellar basal body-associated protein FliL
MKENLESNNSQKKEQFIFVIASIIVIIIAIAIIGIAYSAKNKLNQKAEQTRQLETEENTLPNNDSTNQGNVDSDSTVEEEIRRIDTEIEDNKTNGSEDPSSISVNREVWVFKL